MKKIKRFFSSSKSNADASSFRGSLGKRNSSLSSLASSTLNYDIKQKDLDKIHKAVLSQDEKKVELLAPKYVNTRDKGDRTPLHLACAIGNVAIVEKLLSWKALINVPDRENKTPLFKAIECGHEDCAKLLIQTKVGLTVYDKDGNSCLHHLCIHGMSDLIPLVLEKLTVADANKRNKFGQNPLHLAIEKNNSRAIGMLLKKGVDANAYNQNNITPLMMACYRGHKDIVLLLLKYGADPSLKDSSGNTAADLAMKMNYEDCVKEIEYFHERDANHETSSTLEDVCEEGPSKVDISKTKEGVKEEDKMEEVEEDEDEDDEESEMEANDFYKGKANMMLSKILKEDAQVAVLTEEQPKATSLASVKKISWDNNDDDDDDDENEESNDINNNDVEDKKSNLSIEKQNEIPVLNNQLKFLSKVGGLTDVSSMMSDAHNKISNVCETGEKNLQIHEEEDGSCWDSSCEDIPNNVLKEQHSHQTNDPERDNAFPLSEIKYPVMTEKFQNLDLNSPDHSFHESSDEALEETGVMKQRKQSKAHNGRRLSSIENQIGSFIKIEDQNLKDPKEHRSLKNTFVEDWDKDSEGSLNSLDHLSEAAISRHSIHATKSQSTTFNNEMIIERVSSKNSQANISQEVVLQDGAVVMKKDFELEQVTRKMKILEDENIDLKLKLKRLAGDENLSEEAERLKETINNLREELNKVLSVNSNLRTTNEEITKNLNSRELLLDQEAQRYKNEILSLKEDLSELHDKLAERQQAGSDRTSQKENELRKALKVSDEKLQNQIETSKDLQNQLSEQKSKNLTIELENNQLKMSLNGKVSQCREMEKEIDRLKMQYDNITKELLAEKEKYFKANLNAESHMDKINALHKEMDILKDMKNSMLSTDDVMKAEYNHKISLLDDLNEELKKTISKLREEMDSQRSKHENECRELAMAKNELFNKLVVAESTLKKESLSKQFLESEVKQTTKELEMLKQKLSAEQSQRQAIEFKMISVNHQMEASKTSSISVESRLNRKSEALSKIEKENESLKASLHKIELDKVKLESSLKFEQQLKERMQEELIETKNKLSESLRDANEHLRTKMFLKQKVQDLSGSKDLAVMEAENHRELWENEIKSKSKLGLREQIKLKKAMETNLNLNEELKLQKHKDEILTQTLDDFNRIPSAHHKSRVKYNSNRYLIDATCKKCRRTNDEKIVVSGDLKRIVEKMKREIEQKTQAEFLEKIHQVYQFLEEQTIIRSMNEHKRMENWALLRENHQNVSEGAQNDVLNKAFSFTEKPSKIQALYDELKMSETRLRGHLNQTSESYFTKVPYSTSLRAYTTEDILHQLEKSIKNYSSTI